MTPATRSSMLHKNAFARLTLFHLQMKAIMVFLSFGWFTSYAQTDTLFNQMDQMGRKQGFWKIKRTNKDTTFLYAIEHYQDNKKNGLCIYYYSNGKKFQERHFKNDQLDGVSRVYRTYGPLLYEEKFVADRLNGIKKYYDTEGKLNEEQEYTNGARTGTYLFYSKKGFVIVESFYIKGIRITVCRLLIPVITFYRIW